MLYWNLVYGSKMFAGKMPLVWIPPSEGVLEGCFLLCLTLLRFHYVVHSLCLPLVRFLLISLVLVWGLYFSLCILSFSGNTLSSYALILL